MGIPSTVFFGQSGGSGPSGLITIQDATYEQEKSSPSYRSGYKLNNTGSIYANLPEVYVGNWITNPAFIANYQVKATVESGATPAIGSGFGTWLDLTTTRFWGLSAQDTSVLLIEIRNKNTLELEDSAHITLITYGGIA